MSGIRDWGLHLSVQWLISLKSNIYMYNIPDFVEELVCVFACNILLFDLLL